MKKSCYENFTDCYVEYKEYYKKNRKNAPKLSLISYEEFINDIDNNFEHNCAKEITSELVNLKYYYLFIIILRKGTFLKVFDYYKVWRRVEDELPILQKGIEKRYWRDNKDLYISAAMFKPSNLDHILSFMLHNQNNSFIYGSKSDTVLNSQNSIRLYDCFGNLENHICTNELLDFKRFFHEMQMEEAVIRLSSDGEKTGMDILKKEALEMLDCQQ